MYWVEITEDNLYDLQEQFGWKGDGTVGNPIILEKIEDINEFLRFKSITSNVKVKNLTLCELKVRSCQNIDFENCKVYYCWVEFCSNIKIRNSSIVHLNIEFSRGNVITKNHLHEESGWSKDTLNNNGEQGNTLKYFMNISMGIFFLILGIFILIITKNIIFVWVPPSALIFLIPAVKFKLKISSMKIFPSNLFNGNEFVDLKEIDEKYSAVYDI